MLYLHIPLCASKCHYCDFYSIAARGVDSAAIVRAMIDEIDRRAAQISRPLPSIYFGGGTPSLLTIEQIHSLLGAVQNAATISPQCEITLEANPEQLSANYLESLRSVGINRLSIGVQSFSDQRLSAIGRRHNAKRAIEAIETAQRVGFDNISIDLMFGFGDMEFQEWNEQIDRALGLGVEHLSAYQLSIEPRTVFARRGIQCAQDDQAAAQYELLCNLTKKAGFEHYEISNFALPDHRSQHNSGYWTGRPYVGIGASAHSFDGARTRSWNVASVKDYINSTPPQHELLTDDDIHNEFVMTRLRMSEGFSLDEYQQRFDRRLPSIAGLQITDNRASIKECDMFIADSIICGLFI